jgi:hypothetical protein
MPKHAVYICNKEKKTERQPKLHGDGQSMLKIKPNVHTLYVSGFQTGVCEDILGVCKIEKKIIS